MSEEKQVRKGGIESKLDSIAIFYILISVFALIVCLIASQSETYQGTSLSFLLILVGIAALAQGIIIGTLFKAAAEIIRLLKKLNGLPYAGIISETKIIEEGFECSECHAIVPANAKICPNCGAEFEE